MDQHPAGKLDDGRKVTVELFRKIVREELDKLAAAVGDAGLRCAATMSAPPTLIDRITTAPDFGTFITLPAYQEIN